MILISHRGNINGREFDKENSPSQLERCISLGYDVEFDLRFIDGAFFLGHDTPDYKIDLGWLESVKGKSWIHCKNTEALDRLSGSDFNYFWHDTDDYTLTSKGIIWVYPGKKLCRNSIAVKPESWTNEKELDCLGVCTDHIVNFIEL